MTDIWEEQNRFEIWVKIEIAALEAMEKINIIPEGTATKVEKKASFDIDRINAIEKEIKLGKKQVGWKLGFGSQAGLKALGINRPLIGALFDSGKILSNTQIDLEAIIDPRVEAELAAHISSDIPSNATFDQIKNCISSLVAGIEFVDFHSPPKSNSSFKLLCYVVCN